MNKNTVIPLRPIDSVIQDAEPIASIYRNLGTEAADRVVSQAVSELALTMTGLQNRITKRDLVELPRQLRKLQRMADHLGLVSLAKVAAQLGQCLDHSDATTFAAVWARLLRVAERSLALEKQVADRSTL